VEFIYAEELKQACMIDETNNDSGLGKR